MCDYSKWTARKPGLISLTVSVHILALLVSSSASAQSAAGDIPITTTGDIACEWGSRDCNRCVDGVEDQIKTLQFEPTGRFTYWSGARRRVSGMKEAMLPLSKDELPEGLRNKGHIQGFNRIPALGNNNWIVASVDSNKPKRPGQPAGLLFAQMTDIVESNRQALGGAPFGLSGDPDRFWIDGQAPNGPKPPRHRAARYFHRIAATAHPGGLQTIGRIVAVSNFCNGPEDVECTLALGNTPLAGSVNDVGDAGETGRNAFVDFIEVSPGRVGQQSIRSKNLGRLLLGDIGFFLNPYLLQNKAFFLSIVRMENRHYLLMVNRSNHEHMQFFVSSSETIDSATKWFYKGYRDFSMPTYQNTSFVTDCSTRQIYLLGYLQSPPWTGLNRVDLFRLVEDGTVVNIEKVRDVVLSEAADSCEFKGGSGVYVARHGQLVVYCSQGRSIEEDREDQDALLLNFSEFAGSYLPECGEGLILSSESCVLLDDLLHRSK